jgi:hypothetical protein
MPLARIWTALAVAAFAAACAEEQMSDERFRDLLIGKWGETREIGDELHKQVIRLNPDRSFAVSGTITKQGAKMNFAFSGSWDVRQGLFWYKTFASEPKDFYPASEEHKDRIVSVTSHEWVMIEESTGQKSRARRYQEP